MASWGEFERASPEMAAAGRRMWTQIDLAYIGTVSSTGWPRIHPIVVVFVEDELMFAIGEQTPKFGDLQRDPRCALHTPHLNADDEELFVRGLVRSENDAAGRAHFDSAAPYALKEHEFVYALDLERVLWTTWERPGQDDTRPVRRLWRAGD